GGYKHHHVQGQAGTPRVHRLPGDARRGSDLGEARRLHVAEQEGAPERLQRPAAESVGARLHPVEGHPFRPIRPRAAGLRRHHRAGRLKDLPGLPQEAEQHERDGRGARVGGCKGVQEVAGVAGGATITAEPPVEGAPLGRAKERLGRYAVAAVFLAPTFVLLGVWIVYPAVYTIARSFFGASGFGDFAGIDNYKALFTTSAITTAIKNNAIWVAVVPASITAIGLVFAVLTERIAWSLAFKTVVFMPMAISLFAAGVIWRIMDRQEPQLGAVNAVIRVVHDEFSPPGALSDALPSTPSLTGSPQTGLTLQHALRPGQTAPLGLTGIPPDQVPKGAVQAVQPRPAANGIAGVVWRDFKPGGGTPGKVERGELGLPGVIVELKDAKGAMIGSTSTE